MVRHEGVPTTYFKSWFHESDPTMVQSRLKDGAWLANLKEKVAPGKGRSLGGLRVI
ncbi:hypothetical protein DXG01_009169 [Tephrocybe rancida]|nr:hypothetical protein DXG01_009169 [Tephrocybe rancida]